MKKLPILPALFLAACAPATGPAAQPVSPPVTYAAAPAEVYPVIVQAIVTDPGVPSYKHGFQAGENMRRDPKPWQITAGDQAGGFIQARSESQLTLLTGGDSGEREAHTLSVTLAGTTNTLVSITASERAAYLKDKVFAALDARFQRVP